MLTASPIYKYVDESGVVTYSDTPKPGSVEVDVPPIQQYSAPPTSSTSNKSANGLPVLPPPKPTSASYTYLGVKEPKEGDVFDSSTDRITVTGDINPALDSQDMVQLTLDGQVMGALQNSLVFTLPRLQRGDHTVSLAVVNPSNPKQILIKSKTVKFFQFRVSTNFPNQQQQQNQGNVQQNH